MILKGGIIYTMEDSKPFIGDIRVEKGIIREIEYDIMNLKDEEVFDCDGMLVFPGFIDAHTHLGLAENGIGFEGNDVNERSKAITPNVKAIDGINPMDACFDEGISAGVTSVGVGPGSANVVGGEFTYIKLSGNNISDMIVRECVGIKCSFGENPKLVYGKKGKSPLTRIAIASELRNLLFKAKEYLEKKEEHLKENGDLNLFDKNYELEPMIRVIKGEIPLKAHAHRADDILSAIRIAKEFGVELTIEHCSDGHLIAEHVAASGFPAIVGPTFGHRTKFETKNKTFRTPNKLHEKGVKVAITTDHPVIPIRELRICGAYAAKYGMGKMEALKAITIYPAEILGVSDITGSLKVGKMADIVVWDSHPFDIFSDPKLVLIDGKKVLVSEK
ncbi:MAG: amidohydrolase [Acidaminobacteraceae bacterium]